MSLSCFPIRRALRNVPASYEHEVNKTLGRHKSQANDMSGAEIRLQQSAEHGRRSCLVSCSPAAPAFLPGPNV